MHQGGLADEFQKATGLDPSDPKNEQAMNDWGIWYASKHGFGKWSSVTGGRVPAPRMTGSGAGAGFGSAPDAATAMEKNPLFKDHAALSN